MDFSIVDFSSCVDREISKRLTTYPRIIAKLYKNSASEAEIAKAQHEQNVQMYNIQNIRFCLSQDFIPAEPAILSGMLTELKREFKMRKKCYPRWVWFHTKSNGKSGISQETATQELAIWKSLIIHFENLNNNGTGI